MKQPASLTRLAAALVAATALAAGGCVPHHARGSNDDLYAPSQGGGGDRGPTATRNARPVEAPKPPGPIERWAALTHELASQLATAGRSCAQVAHVLRAFVTTNGKELGKLQGELVRWERQTPEKTVERFYRDVFPDMNARIDAGIRCKDDAQARAAFDQFFSVAGLDR
ncbi:MAG: hypothetical protein U1F43_23455 [Myxococcota bacterium]